MKKDRFETRVRYGGITKKDRTLAQMSICIVVDFVGARGYQIAKQCSLNLIASLARKETYLVAWYDVDLLRLRLRC